MDEQSVTRKSLLLTLALVFALALPGAAAAQAPVSLGSTAQPAGSSFGPCFADLVFAPRTDPTGIPYHVPGAGTISQWQIGTGPPTVAGQPVTFVILRPTSASTFKVVATDSRTLPNPLPAGGIATYILPAPVPVIGGDTFGLWADGASVICYWYGGATSLFGTITQLSSPAAPAIDQSLSPTGNSPDGYQINAGATFLPQPVPAGPPAVKTPPKKKCKKAKKKSAAAAKKKCKKKRK